MRARQACLLGIVAILAFASRVTGDTVVYTENWASANGNWQVQSGSPAYGTLLRNTGSASNPNDWVETRMIYTGSISSDAYSVESWVHCGNFQYPMEQYPLLFHYLRSSGTNHYRTRVLVVGNSNYQFTLYVYLDRRIGNTVTTLASTSFTMEMGGAYMKTTVIGNQITVSWWGQPLLIAYDNTLTSGGIGVGTARAFTTNVIGLGTTTLGYPSVTLAAPTGLAAAPYATQVNLSWNAVTGAAGYNIYRNGAYLGSSATTSFQDLTVTPSFTYTPGYTVKAYSSSGTMSNASSALQVTTPSYTYSAPVPGSPTEFAAAWGAGPEQIALSSGALGLRIPLVKLAQRSGPGFHLTASWNSHFWQQDAAGTRMTASDTGFGLGWLFLVGGGIYPVYSGNTLVRYEFQDQAGLVHRLEPAGTNQYRSQDSSYLLWNDSTFTLYFRDGSFWNYDAVSRHPEADAGARYPTRLTDSNGNYITVEYKPAATWTAVNTSSRVAWVRDTVTKYIWEYTAVNGSDHVTRIYHVDPNGPPETPQYTDVEFIYATQSGINAPAGMTALPSALTRVLLTQIKFTGGVGPYAFAHNTHAEIGTITFPYRGTFAYDYLTANFSSGARKVREVWKRTMDPDGTNGSTPVDVYEFTHPATTGSMPAHPKTLLRDAAGNDKVWLFIQGSGNLCPSPQQTSRGWDNGFACRQETWQVAGVQTPALKQAAETEWTQDNPATNAPLSNPRPLVMSTILEGGAVKSKREQTVDANGNVTVAKDYAYNQATPYRTTAIVYETGSSYTSRNILSLVKEVRVCAGNSTTCGTPESLATNTYDTTYANYPAGTAQWDAAYAQVPQRGNLTSTNANGRVTNFSYDGGGNRISTTDASGGQSTATYSSSNYTQVTYAAGGGQSTTLGWNADLTLASQTGSNNDTTNFNYTNYRPTSIIAPNGSPMYFGYNDTTYPLYKRTTNGNATRESYEYYDGFGRVTQTKAKDIDWYSFVFTDTKYSACSCGSTGKAVKISQPYRIYTTPSYWTETQHDALGRPTLTRRVDNAGVAIANTTTTYAYAVQNDAEGVGIVTTITDPANRQKSYLHDAFGRLVWVKEAHSTSGMVVTARYFYDYMGRLTRVEMPKQDGSYTQVRTFTYNTKGELLSATNPESGTVTYAYLANGQLDTKTDAKSQVMKFLYDTYRRLTTIQSPAGTTKTTFVYTGGGRLYSAANDGYTWTYAYDTMGRVTGLTLATPFLSGGQPLQAKATYAYDTSTGDLSGISYPAALATAPEAATQSHTYSYDYLGRPTGLDIAPENSTKTRYD